MAFPRNSLRAFLQYARTNLTEALKRGRKVNIVIGNESADLDSFTSSLLYAYLKSTSPPSGAFSPIYIPLLNIPSSGLRLRPEFTTVCNHAGIPPSKLLNLDDIRPGFIQPENTRWILVDHNKLQGPLGSHHSSRVTGVIDHHEEENFVPSTTTPEPRIIEKAGSCTSLVVRYCRPLWDAISDASLSSGAGHGQGESAINDSAFTRGWDAQVAKLALASILIDTTDLTAEGKVEEVDRVAVRYLESKVLWSANDARSWDRERFFEEISEAKKQIGHLTLEETFIKDYKEWTEDGKKLGVSSVVKPLAFLVGKGLKDEENGSFEKVVSAFMAERDLSLYAIMTTSTDDEGSFKRELLLQAMDPAVDDAVRFVGAASSAFQLEQMELDIKRQTESTAGQIWRDFWTQRDLGKSRKQVAPMLREAMNSSH